MRGKWILFAAAAILLAIAAGALSWLKRPQDVAQAGQKTPERVRTATGEILLMGSIQAAQIIPVPAPIDGVLDVWLVEPGQEVLEGQQLGHIVNTGLENARQLAQSELERAQSRVTAIEGSILAARLEAARASADAARAQEEESRLAKVFAKQQLWYREGATPRLVFEKADREYKAAQEEAATARQLAEHASERVAQLEKELQLAKSVVEERTAALEAATQQLEAGNIIAPAAGLVLKLGVEAGGEVSKDMRDLVQIAVNRALLLVALEPEPPVLEKMQPGLPALVLVPEVLGDPLEGRVKEIKGTQVLVEFTSPAPEIRPGMTASVRIKLT